MKLPKNVWRALRVYCVLADKSESPIIALAVSRYLDGATDAPAQVKQLLREPAASAPR